MSEASESRFRVVRVVVLWEVIEEDAEGRFLGSYSDRGAPITEGDPTGEGRSIGERVDAALAGYCEQARTEKGQAAHGS